MKAGLAAQLDLVPTEQVAKRLGLSRQRVQQIESAALAKLRTRPEMLELLGLAALRAAGCGVRDMFARTPKMDWGSLKEIPMARNGRK